MISAEDLKATITRVCAILSEQKIKYHITGGLASSLYGEPRFTQDIDIVIKISIGSALVTLITRLSESFYVEPDSVEDAVRRGSIFQALDEKTLIKVDFHVGESIPGELERSKVEELLPGVTVPIVSKEDSILSKLLWIKKGSHKSRQDVKLMLKSRGVLDLAYIDHQAAHLGVSELLMQLRNELSSEG